MSITLVGVSNLNYGVYKAEKNYYDTQISGLYSKLASLNCKLNEYVNDKSLTLEYRKKLIDNVELEISSLKLNIAQLDRTFTSKIAQVLSHDHLVVIKADGINRPSGNSLVDVYI